MALNRKAALWSRQRRQRGAVAVRRQQPAQARGRQVPQLGKGGL